jgi:drug/metabolite transporter (DMT)-like permease
LIPAALDMTGTTLSNIGLILTYPSVYQMLRGMIVVFTAIFSRIFLRRTLVSFHYCGMFLIIVGTFLVGLSSIVNHDTSSNAPSNPMLGDFFVVAAQVVAATQMVVEEKLIGKYNVHPLQVVGNEGVFGFLGTTVILFIFYWIKPIRDYDNSIDAAYQIYYSLPLKLLFLGCIISIAFYNFFGISVTKYLSATHRTTIDASRVFFVWLASLLLKWETFQWLQLVGFLILLCGTTIFNEIVRLPFFNYPVKPAANVSINEAQPLLDEEQR